MEEGQENSKNFFHPRILAASITLIIVGSTFLFLHSHLLSHTVSKQILAVNISVSKAPTATPTSISTPTFMPTPPSTPTVAPTATPTPTSVPTANPTSDNVWDSLAQCESGGNWAEDTGNGYFGGLQFNQSAWASVGGSGSPASASRTEQISRGKMLQAQRGWSPWGTCSRRLGLN